MQLFTASMFISETQYDRRERAYNLGEQLVSKADREASGVKVPAAHVIYGASKLQPNKLHKRLYFMGRTAADEFNTGDDNNILLTLISPEDAADAAEALGITLEEVPRVPLREQNLERTRARRAARNTIAASSAATEVVTPVADPQAFQ